MSARDQVPLNMDLTEEQEVRPLAGPAIPAVPPSLLQLFTGIPSSPSCRLVPTADLLSGLGAVGGKLHRIALPRARVVQRHHAACGLSLHSAR